MSWIEGYPKTGFYNDSMFSMILYFGLEVISLTDISCCIDIGECDLRMVSMHMVSLLQLIMYLK